MLNHVDLARVDLNLLVVFGAVYTERHVGKAARTLHVTPSAVSHGLGRLRQLFDDPLFLKAPKGVVPTARALELAPAVDDILLRVRGVVGGLERFDPKTSTRCFRIGAPDSTIALFFPPLAAALEREAPRVDLSTRSLLPQLGFEDLDSGAIDLAVLPLDDAPARFATKPLFDDVFVIGARAGHPFLKAPSLRRYCELSHAVVSMRGDNHGYIDDELAKLGLSRRVALSVPNFMLVLAVLAETDLLAAIPSPLAAMHAARFGVATVKCPFPLRSWPQQAIVPRVALSDPGIAWLLDVLERALQSRPKRAPSRRRR